MALPALQPHALDRLTRSEMYSLTEPHCTPVHRRPTSAFATATKICTGVSDFPLHPCSRNRLHSGPRARLLPGCSSPAGGVLSEGVQHRQFSAPMHSAGVLLHTPITMPTSMATFRLSKYTSFLLCVDASCPLIP